MSEFIEFLSGGIPGGAVLLVAVLIFANLTLSFLRKSELISRERLFSRIASINIVIIILYTLLWAAKKPPQPADRIIILPTLSSNNSLELNEKSLVLADLFEKNAYNFKGRYLVHKWEWLYKTLSQENLSLYESWNKLAQNLDPSILVESTFNESGAYLIKAHIKGEQEVVDRIIMKDSLQEEFITFIADLNLTFKRDTKIEITDGKYLKAELLINEGKLEQAHNLLESDSSQTAKIILAKLFVNKGLQFKYDYDKLKYVEIINPDFEKAKKILYPMIKSKKDPPGVAFLIGRMAIREQKYERAEIFLKKAFVDEPRNSRVYYLMSHLLSSRLEELGFENRKSILLKTIEQDPGYADPVFDLANLFYITGNGYEKGMGTTGALKTLEKYLLLNNNDPKILGLLATLYIKTSKFEKAKEIYQKLAVHYPKDSNVIYNLGIVSYSQSDYENALKLFNEAIELDNNLDAYLYAGITSQMLGKREQALKYYQDRVRYKKSDDDPYAKEAMLGIRKIQEEIALENQDIKN